MRARLAAVADDPLHATRKKARGSFALQPVDLRMRGECDLDDRGFPVRIEERTELNSTLPVSSVIKREDEDGDEDDKETRSERVRARTASSSRFRSVFSQLLPFVDSVSSKSPLRPHPFIGDPTAPRWRRSEVRECTRRDAFRLPSVSRFSGFHLQSQSNL